MEILTIYHKFLRNSVPIAAVILLLQYNHMLLVFLHVGEAFPQIQDS